MPTLDTIDTGVTAPRGRYSATALQRYSATRRIIRRETTVLISVTRRVYLYGQRVGFYKLLRSHLIVARRIPGMGTPSVSCTKPATR